ncbi:hypothetical protein OKW21_003431 [Catalinimonas alkaloidigena]|uniref:carboxypeptidase-like regulatory domain-containing protein n=1 Tax=Catalinimonas alkaloidigena TaxID=1075417 RepID=UPI002405BDDD|nr:carboxypeptidase-like regulatory domain-containing protein [Catalinimonas alkaloidigena]MDF9798168.1 hypothetical protein [Catalinimonas alkaloidigena]
MVKKSLTIAVFMLLISSPVEAQFIFGEVLDHETDSVIAYANIYFNNSFNGTTSDLDGHFKLNISQNRGQDISVSCMGYYSQSIQDFNEGTFYRVYLKPKPNMLKELVIVSDDVAREKKLKMFMNEFLGSSSNAKNCTIENPEDIRLVYFKSTHTLEAYCDAPLKIHNKALGYQITYFLEEFTHSGQRTFYKGTSIFEEDTSLTARNKKKVRIRRRKAYLGSRMHFFRALWADKLEHENFSVRNTLKGNSLSCQEIVASQGQYVKHLSSVVPLSISYARRMSYITFYQDKDILFTQNGFFDPDGHYWDGNMAQHRMGDYLPFEYTF